MTKQLRPEDEEYLRLIEERLRAVMRQDWARAREIEKQLQNLQVNMDLVHQLWPGARVSRCIE